LALALSRLVQSMLFEVSPLDPLSFSLVPALLLMVGGLACYLPARRIAQVDSITALRSD
jgi:ABC-type antimicrobial peptide transport system permease subunit